MTASVTFVCHADGRVVPDLWADPHANEPGNQNALAIERLVRVAMRAQGEHRAAIESAVNMMKHCTATTHEEDAAYKELLANPAGFRWLAHGRKGQTVSAIHPRFPYIAFQVCITNDRALSRHIAEAHNAALGEDKE